MKDLKNNNLISNLINIMSDYVFTNEEFNQLFSSFKHHKQSNNKQQMKNIINIAVDYIKNNFNHYDNNVKALSCYALFLLTDNHTIDNFNDQNVKSIINQFFQFYDEKYKNYEAKINNSHWSNNDRDVVDMVFARSFAFNEAKL